MTLALDIKKNIPNSTCTIYYFHTISVCAIPAVSLGTTVAVGFHGYSRRLALGQSHVTLSVLRAESVCVNAFLQNKKGSVQSCIHTVLDIQAYLLLKFMFLEMYLLRTIIWKCTFVKADTEYLLCFRTFDVTRYIQLLRIRVKTSFI